VHGYGHEAIPSLYVAGPETGSAPNAIEFSFLGQALLYLCPTSMLGPG